MKGLTHLFRFTVCVIVAVVSCTAGSRASDLGGYVHRTQQAPYTFENTIVRLHFDFQNGIVYGDETAIVRPKRSIDVVPFNTKQIQYDRVTVNGQNASYQIDEPRELMNVHLHSPAPAGERLVVEFRYSAKPLRGLYFVRPDTAYPNVVPQIWTQGEPTDNRRWFPTWDEPNQKTPNELIVTVPKEWTVIGNGYLKSRTQSSSGETWDWNSPIPKSTYLIAFAAGPLVEHRTNLGKLDVDSFVQPASADLNALCFGRTKDMIAYYQRITGVPFPFEKYDQVTAERFIFGGMENASVTIQTDLELHPAIVDVEDSCDVPVSHELAQHWYGDDATMADWANIWLNEGFATYYDELWTGERFGTPDFEYARYNAQQAYFAETRQYMRPIVDYKYRDPLQLLVDASSHQRPAQALHMLRTMYGDAKFFRAVDYYLREYAYKNADTHQFFAAIGKALGTDLSWFENEWFYRSSYPHYYVTERYDAQAHSLRLHVEQRNPDGKPFSMPVVVEAFSGGHVAKVDPAIDRNEQDIVIRNVPVSPQMVLFDPNNNVLRQLTFNQSVGRLTYQLAHAEHVADREWVLQQLAGYAKAKGEARSAASNAVANAVEGDPFWGMRADAAGAAASFDDSSAVQSALHDRDVRVRIAAANAAGSLTSKTQAVIDELQTMSNDLNPDVAAAAFTALGSLQPPGTFDRLVAALNRSSFQQTVAAGVLSGLATNCDARGFALIKARTVYGTQEQERDAAVQALAQCALQMKKPELALAPLVDLVTNDPLVSTRIAAAAALGTLHDISANLELQRVELTDSQELVRENAHAALAAQSR